MKKPYQMIRGKLTEARCDYMVQCGYSPLYCDCGCQEPCDDDPDINLSGITVYFDNSCGDMKFLLKRDGVRCGTIDPGKDYLFLDGVEYLGVDPELLRPLAEQCYNLMNKAKKNIPMLPGETLEETATQVRLYEILRQKYQDNRNAKHSGYCTRCHSYCYGDCEANL